MLIYLPSLVLSLSEVAFSEPAKIDEILITKKLKLGDVQRGGINSIIIKHRYVKLMN